MPQKSHRSRIKHKRRSTPQLLAIKETGQSPQMLPPSPKPVSITKSEVTTPEQAHHQICAFGLAAQSCHSGCCIRSTSFPLF